MRQRSNLIILFGLAFLLVGGAIVWLIVSDGDDDSVAASDGPTVSVLVAKDDIPANTVGTDAIERGLLETKEIAVSAQPADAISSATALENRIFAVDVGKGSTISNSQLVTRSVTNLKVPEGYDGIAVTVQTVAGGAGSIAPGDQVNVYGLYRTAEDTTDAGLTSEIPVPRTELALTNVTVLAVDRQAETAAQRAAQPADGEAQPAPPEALTFLLALTPTDAERVIHLTAFADIYLGLTAEDAPPVGDTPGVDGSSVNAPVSAASARPAA